MSGSDRGDRTAAISWAFPLLGILIALGIAWGIGWLQAREEYKRQSTPAAYAAAAKDDAKRACVGTDAAAVFECVDQKAKAAYQTAHDELDLSAQQRAASSALASVIVSFLALVISVVGVRYVKQTLDATLQAVKDTGEATQAMLAQNVLAKEANRIAEAAQRPWIAISAEVVGRQVHEEGYVLFVDVTFENIGQSVAHGFWHHVKTFVASGDYRPSVRAIFDEWAMPKGVSTNVLMPGEKLTASYFHIFKPANGEWRGEDPSCDYVIAAAAFYYVTEETIYDNRCVTQRTFRVGSTKRDPLQRYKLFKADLNEGEVSDFIANPVIPRKST